MWVGTHTEQHTVQDHGSMDASQSMQHCMAVT